MLPSLQAYEEPPAYYRYSATSAANLWATFKSWNFRRRLEEDRCITSAILSAPWRQIFPAIQTYRRLLKYLLGIKSLESIKDPALTLGSLASCMDQFEMLTDYRFNPLWVMLYSGSKEEMEICVEFE